MKRGLPRPTNRDGRPVPYVASGPNTLGEASLRRLGEVYRDKLCQVCGLTAQWPALVVFRTDDARWWPNGRIQDGLIHDECCKLALQHCPYLSRHQGFDVLRVTQGDVNTDHGQWRLLSQSESLRVPLDTLLA